MTKKYRTIRAIVEIHGPPEITEKQLVHKLKEMIKWPIQVGQAGDLHTLLQPEFKQYTRVSANDFMRRRGILRSLLQKGDPK